MSNFDAIQPNRTVISILSLLGLWTFTNTNWFYLYRFYTYILHFLFSLLFTIMMNIYLVSADNLRDFLESIFMTFTLNAMMVKQINVVYYGREVLQLLQNFQHPYFQPQNEAERKLFKSRHISFNRLKIFYLILCLSVISLAYINAFVAKKMPYVAWFPFDWRANITYFYYAYLYEVVAMTVDCLSNCSLDLLQAYILFQTGVNYDLIAMRLRCVGYENGKNANAFLMSAEDESVANENLVKTIHAHQMLTSMAKQVETIISAPVAFQNFLSAAVICLTAYELVSVSVLDNPIEFVSLLYFLMAMAFQIFLPCFYGDIVTDKSHMLCDAMYSSNWVLVSVKMKKFIFIYMESLKKPIIIKAGSLFNVGLSVFSKTMNNSYSLFAVLINLEKK